MFNDSYIGIWWLKYCKYLCQKSVFLLHRRQDYIKIGIVINKLYLSQGKGGKQIISYIVYLYIWMVTISISKCMMTQIIILAPMFPAWVQLPGSTYLDIIAISHKHGLRGGGQLVWGLDYCFLMQLKIWMFQTGGMPSHQVPSFDSLNYAKWRTYKTSIEENWSTTRKA